MARHTTPPEIRFAKHVAVAGNGCHEWTAGIQSGSGYGKFALAHSKSVPAHRFAYELANGPIPDDLVIDHLCRNKRCVNPDHLEAVTPAENNRRHYALQTHCKNGHPREGVNVIVIEGQIKCRACRRDISRKYRGQEPLGPVPVTTPLRSGPVTHCPQGHEYTDENTYVTKRGARMCRECIHIRKTTTPRCPRGHVYDEVGTKIDKKGRRWCLGCYPGPFLRERDTCPDGHPYVTTYGKRNQRWCGICSVGRPKKRP